MNEVEIIKRIQTVRSGFLDAVFTGITQLGDELFFILIAAVVFWCFDKRFGYKLINVYFIGSCAVEGMKALVKRPRPYTHSGIKSVTDPTGGWSFPSGHSHSIANLSTQLSGKVQKTYGYIVASVVMVLVAFSRMYLGQHFLTDVIVGLALGVALATVLSMLFELLKDKEEYLVLGVAPVCLIVLLILVITGAHKSAGNVLKVLGAYIAVSVGYYFEKKYVRCNMKNKWYFQILKVVIGLALTLAVKEGFKLFLPKSIPLLYNFLRYLMVGLVAVLGAPALFKVCKLSPPEEQTDTTAAQQAESSDAEMISE